VTARDVDVLVIGSGFGGSVAALRLAEKGYRVAVLEAGRRFGADDFARTNWDLRRYLFMPRLGLHGIQRISMLDDLVVLSGAGVGGGSLVYANTLYEPLDPFYDDPQWSAIADWRAELAPFYALARRMLGVVETPFETPAEGVVREVARRMGVGDTFHRTPVGVYFGDEDGVDPYFGGAGPLRSPCIRCGGCMVGCRHNAKNTLDRNYLWLAERAGAVVHPDREATLLRRTDGGWEVEAVRPGAWTRTRPELFRAEHVVLAAGVLGTLRLLFRSGLGGANVGALVRSNSEVIVGAGAPDASVDYSAGIAIGSSFHPSAETHIEPVRYPKGSSMMGLFSTILVDGGGSTPRPVRWLRGAVRDPGAFLRSHRVRRWAERTVILLVMQARDNSLRIRWTGRRLRSGPGHGEPAPSWIPEANEAARIAAEVMGGLPGSGLNEVLLNRPFTAHILGGAAIGASPGDGVLDAWHRVWGEPGLHVVDGAAVSANLGANPSLTIAAQAERALAFWPNRGEPDPRPPLGSAYAPVEPVAARSPAVPV
jgi:cholesterol oxidase